VILNVVLAILALSIIVVIHEFGHFIVAKANGVAVLEFALGFGPRIIQFKKKETVYCIKLLPFGGSCMMQGDQFMENLSGEEDLEDTKDSDNESSDAKKSRELAESFDADKSFSSKSVWSRIAIIAAGPLFNFLLALVLSVVMIGITGYDYCTIDKVYDDSPAAQAGLAAGDKILKINNENISCAREYSFYRYYHAAQDMEITYERDGNKYTTSLTPQYKKTSAYRIGITISQHTVGSVTQDSPAAAAGMKANDIIRAVDGVEMESDTQFTETLAQSGGKTLTITVERDGATVDLSVTPALTETESYYTGLACYGYSVKTSPVETVICSFRETGYWIETVIESLEMMFTGQVGINDLSGPVGTVSIMSDYVGESRSGGVLSVVMSIFYLMIMISANLGVMNLLPLPALDGGRLVFFLVEVVRGKPVAKEREGMVHFIGMVLLMILMVYVMFKDIKGLF
jgi:regulator of sigma E protease